MTAKSEQEPSSASEFAVGALALAVIALITFFGVRTSQPDASPPSAPAPPSADAPPVESPRLVEPAQPPQGSSVPGSPGASQRFTLASEPSVPPPGPGMAATPPPMPAPLRPALDPRIEYSPAPLATTNPLETEGVRTTRGQAPDPSQRDEAARAEQKSWPAKSAQTAEPARPARAETFAGVWAREARDCRHRDGDDDQRIRIDQRGAQAVGARCVFHSVKQETAGRWRVRALCTVAPNSWTANISLRLVGPNLRWSSERGTETYVRCPKQTVPEPEARQARHAN